MPNVNEKSQTSAIAGYFNAGTAKRPLVDFQKELKALTEDDKRELAEGACAIMGWTLKG